MRVAVNELVRVVNGKIEPADGRSNIEPQEEAIHGLGQLGLVLRNLASVDFPQTRPNSFLNLEASYVEGGSVAHACK